MNYWGLFYSFFLLQLKVDRFVQEHFVFVKLSLLPDTINFDFLFVVEHLSGTYYPSWAETYRY